MGPHAIPQLGNTREQEVKEKLENLRKLFAEEDINETVKGIQHDWELEAAILRFVDALFAPASMWEGEKIKWVASGTAESGASAVLA